ncbi:MAG: B12-binding domain-containing radical SAM protein [Candidatus Omnitrophica bacterium]|nr:B12-binding domain-containing radical SAM protein [Candidatus Omnitrophota bacterium]
MRILLISPPITHGDELQAKARGCMPPLDLMYLAAYVRQYNHDVNMLDLYSRGLSNKKLFQYIQKEHPVVIGFSTYSANIDLVYKLSAIIKLNFPDIKIVLGGIHASYLAGVCLDNPSVDFIVRGEGERTLLELLSAIEDRSDLSQIEGMSYKSKSGIVHNPDRKLIEDIDALPWPAYDLVNFDNYFLAVTRAVTSGRVASVLTARGCPYGCSFCSQSYGYNRRVRNRDVHNVVDEMLYLYDKYDIREFQIEDSSLTADPKRVIKLCQLIEESHMKIIWNCNVRANTASEELFAAMRDAGCRRILLGVESGSQKMLDSMNKGITLEQVRKTVRLAKKYKMRINCAFVVGLPGETYESAMRSCVFSKELDPDYIMFSVLVPSVGSALFEQAVKEKIIDVRNVKGADYISVYSQRLPLVEMSSVKREDLFKLMEKCTISFYLRPKYILKRMIGITSWAELKRMIYGLVLIFRHQMALFLALFKLKK